MLPWRTLHWRTLHWRIFYACGAPTFVAAALLIPLLVTPPAVGAQSMNDHPDGIEALARSDLRALETCTATGEADPSSVTGRVQLQRLRTLYLLAVEDPERIEEARGVQASLVADGMDSVIGGRPLLEAYDAALVLLDAKHGFWPQSRLRHLRSGLERLDQLVESHPRQVEIRYLRLVNTAFLPGILGRGDTVREDLAVLTRLLPDEIEAYPTRTFDAMASTVLDLLESDHAERSRLEAARGRSLERELPLAPGCHGT